MKYFPRIIFIDIENKDNSSNYLKKLNSLKETILVKEYINIIEMKKENNLGNLNAVMRGLKSTDEIKLPGELGEAFNFLNIIYTDKSDKNNIAEILNKVYESTKFQEQGNVNLYILITSTINDFETNIPSQSLGKVIIEKKYEDGSTLTDEEYDKIIIELLQSLMILPERQQVIDYIFCSNPQNNVTVFPRLFTYPDEGYLEKIKEKLLSNVLIKIKDDKCTLNLTSDVVISSNLFQNISTSLKNVAFFKNKPYLKIPFFAGVKKRSRYVKSFLNNYDQNRRTKLFDELNKISFDRNNPALIEYGKRIDETIHIKVNELLLKRFSFGFVIKSLEGLKKNLESEIEKTNYWYFLQDLLIPTIDGRPFEKKYLIPSSVILLVCLSLLLINPYYSLALLAIWAMILALVGAIYLKNLNKIINRQISSDIEIIINLIEKNPQNFILSLRKYIVRRVLKVLSNNITILEKSLKRYEAAFNSYSVTKANETIDVDAFNKIEKIIESSIEWIISSTLKSYKNEIHSNYKDPDIFVYYLLNAFTKSTFFSEIRSTLFNIDKVKIDSQLNIKQKLAISKEIDDKIIKITKRKKIFISKVYKPKDIEIIDSADDYILSILDIGVLNE